MLAVFVVSEIAVAVPFRGELAVLVELRAHGRIRLRRRFEIVVGLLFEQAALESGGQVIRGGGSGQHAKHFAKNNRADYLFHMDGKGIFKIASEILPDFAKQLLAEAKLGWADFKIVIPHQASLPALRLTHRRLDIPKEKFFIFAERVGNTIAASLPMGIHFALEEGRLQRGDKALLLGTSAGFSVGGLALEF